jgi:outer membrane lipoprotein-sorting protein
VYAVHRGLITGVLAILVSQAFAQDAQQVMKRAEAAMKSVKTYQATMVMSMEMGQMGSMSMNMDIKMIPNKKMTMKMSPAGQPTGMMAMGAASMNMHMVDDGKTMWTYMPMMKGYARGPSRVKTNPVNFAEMGNVGKDVTFKMIGTENVGGKSAYAIQAIPKKPIQNAQDTRIVFYIDRATNRFLQMKMNSRMAMGDPKQPPQEMKMSMVVKNEKINAPIPASVFKFTPPPGSKEMKGGMMGGPGMSPFGGQGGSRK